MTAFLSSTFHIIISQIKIIFSLIVSWYLKTQTSRTNVSFAFLTRAYTVLIIKKSCQFAFKTNKSPAYDWHVFTKESLMSLRAFYQIWFYEFHWQISKSCTVFVSWWNWETSIKTIQTTIVILGAKGFISFQLRRKIYWFRCTKAGDTKSGFYIFFGFNWLATTCAKLNNAIFTMSRSIDLPLINLYWVS